MREEFSDFFLGNSLIIAECEEIRMMCAKWGEYILFISEDDTRIVEFSCDILESSVFIMYWSSSLSTDDSMISGNHDRHLTCELSRCREVILMSRMKNIKCTKTHHMVKSLFSERIIEWYIIRNGSQMQRIGKWHKFYQRQIGEKRRLWIQKVNNLQKSFDKMWWKEYIHEHNILYVYVILNLNSTSEFRPIVYTQK